MSLEGDLSSIVIITLPFDVESSIYSLSKYGIA
jgi:hypothetical protein